MQVWRKPGPQGRIQGGGLRGLQPPLWEVFQPVWFQLDDEVEGILGERHFIS